MKPGTLKVLEELMLFAYIRFVWCIYLKSFWLYASCSIDSDWRECQQMGYIYSFHKKLNRDSLFRIWQEFREAIMRLHGEVGEVTLQCSSWGGSQRRGGHLNYLADDEYWVWSAVISHHPFIKSSKKLTCCFSIPSPDILCLVLRNGCKISPMRAA
jgi:hypothetical protein